MKYVMRYMLAPMLYGLLGAASFATFERIPPFLAYSAPITPVADDASIRAAYAFAMTPEVQPTATENEQVAKTAAKVQQNFKRVCSCGRTLDCTCVAGQCDCAACKQQTITPCKCASAEQCGCGCNNGSECSCQVSRQENLKEKQTTFYYSVPPRLTACAGGR